MTVNDLILLEEVGEKQVVKELNTRYRQNDIYTYIGPVLIAVNPYKVLTKNGISLYDNRMMDEFTGKEMHENDPHPFAIAESAYSHFMRFQQNQCLVITGESGSGKTETSKHVMHYITNISLRNRTRIASLSARRMSQTKRQEIDDVVSQVRNVLYGSNPVLESFGNAQTIRNNNSSRFGKYMVLQMNYSGQVVGGFINNYLLEKSRVIQQALGERSFHCFYQLIHGASDSNQMKWGLTTPEDFKILQYDNRVIENVNDKEEFQNVAKNMTAIGIQYEEQCMIYQQIAAVLWLGNIEFVATIDDRNNPSCMIEPSTRDALVKSAELLGIEPEALEAMFTYKTLAIRNQNDHKIPLDAKQGEKVQQSVAKTLYENIFTYLVGKINSSISLKGTSYQNTIGILDIYGFEIFEENAFEQLCINYVNEKLQQLFISQTLQSEQLEYTREGISWDNITYFNNQIVCDLIEDMKVPGIFPLLDEQCAIAQTSTETLITRFNKQYVNHPHYTKSRVKGSVFSIVHYAGSVEYDLSNFAEANMDTFFNDVHSAIANSTNTFIKTILKDDRTEKDKLKRPPTTSVQFRQQVNALCNELNSCNPHYVRCIKPNEDKRATLMNNALVTSQVKCLGLVENIRVRRAGYCYRETYGKFIHRFKMLSKATWPEPTSHSTRQATVELLTAPDIGVLPTYQSSSLTSSQKGLSPLEIYKLHIANKNNKLVEGKIIPFKEDSESIGCFSLGKNKVFIKHPQALFSLERLRIDKLPTIANIIANAWHRRLTRIKLLQFVHIYNDIKSRFDSIVVDCLNRRKRVIKDTISKAHTEDLYTHYHAISTEYLPATNRFDTQLKDHEMFNTVAFTQSHVRAKLQQIRFHKLKQAVSVFSSRWKGRQTRRSMPNELYQQCYQRMLGVRTEFEKYLGEKKRRRDTLDRVSLGDYIDTKSYPAYRQILVNGQNKTLLFAAETLKVNERFVYQPRILMIGDKSIINIKADKKEKPKERRTIPIGALSRISLSPFADNYVVFHVEGDVDLLYEIDQKTEVVELLRQRFQFIRQRPLRVQFTNDIQYEAQKGKKFNIKFVPNPKSLQTLYEKMDRRTLQVTVGTQYKRSN